ncbi:MAG TPA: hypothetical protein VFB07_01475 [Vicinamibacterales bacterium]|nr:hypothetical protein [Vicinamibacterales bacterium]
MARPRADWKRIAFFTAAATLAAATVGYAQLFRPFSDRSTTLLEGNWQSCREADGQYAERVYDGRWPGMEPFELHMGPYHEFAFFRGIQDEHRDHDSAQNLLRPYTVELVSNNAKHSWDVNGLHLDVVLAGGSREDCESWFVTLRRSNPSSH